MKPNKSEKFLVRVLTCIAASSALLVAAGSAVSGDEHSQIKDLHVLQVPMANLEPSENREGSAVADGAKNKQLTVKASVDRADKTYKHGDKLTLSVEATQDAYVWVFDTGTSGKVHQVFPNRHETDNFVRAGTKIMIPKSGADYDFVVSNPQGSELITVIASKDDHALTENMVPENVGEGVFLALNGNASSVAKDLSISLRQKHREWSTDQLVFHIK